jgi:hypothetical protein
MNRFGKLLCHNLIKTAPAIAMLMIPQDSDPNDVAATQVFPLATAASYLLFPFADFNAKRIGAFNFFITLSTTALITLPVLGTTLGIMGLAVEIACVISLASTLPLLFNDFKPDFSNAFKAALLPQVIGILAIIAAPNIIEDEVNALSATLRRLDQTTILATTTVLSLAAMCMQCMCSKEPQNKAEVKQVEPQPELKAQTIVQATETETAISM